MFLRTPIYRVASDLVFGLRQGVIMPHQSDAVIEVTQPVEHRLDLLAYQFYGTPDLWWVIAEINQLLDPFTEVVVGKELRLPQRERLFNALSVSI